MLFNANQPTTIERLAQLYAGNPNKTPDEVNSDLFLNSSQGYGYVQDQGRKLGIGDPAQYFKSALLKRQIATTPSGALDEANRLNGAFSPDSLPGQLAAREGLWNNVMGTDKMRAQELASLQMQQREKQNPLPEPGTPYMLSLAKQEDMRQRGITDPMEYILGQRLGVNRAGVGSLRGIGTRGVNPTALYDTPTFQNAINQNPERAGDIFRALTGTDLAVASKGILKGRGDEDTANTAALRHALENRLARVTENGTVEWAETQFDPTTGKNVPTGKFSAGDLFQRSLSRRLPQVSRSIAELQALEAKGGPTASSLAGRAPVASLQFPQQELAARTETFPIMDSAQGFMAESIDDALGLFRGNPTGVGANTGMVPASGSAVRHAAPLLRNNPRFIELMRRDPDKARRLILSIQNAQ